MKLHWVSELVLLITGLELCALVLNTGAQMAVFLQMRGEFVSDFYDASPFHPVDLWLASYGAECVQALAQVVLSVAAVAILEAVHRTWVRFRDTGRLSSIVFTSGESA